PMKRVSMLNYEAKDIIIPYWPGMKDEMPRVDILHDDYHYIIKAYVPGKDLEDLDIQIQNDSLIIETNYVENIDIDDNSYLHREMFESSFRRSIHLPDDISQDKISTLVKNGVLIVELPKKFA